MGSNFTINKLCVKHWLLLIINYLIAVTFCCIKFTSVLEHRNMDGRMAPVLRLWIHSVEVRGGGGGGGGGGAEWEHNNERRN